MMCDPQNICMLPPGERTWQRTAPLVLPQADFRQVAPRFFFVRCDGYPLVMVASGDVRHFTARCQENLP